MLETDKHNIVLCAHKSPDGDCIGAVGALKNIFTKLGKQVFIVSDYKNETNDKIKNVNQFSSSLSVAKELESKLVTRSEIPEDCHLFIVDHSHKEYSLCNNGEDPKFTRVTLIDHHFAGQYQEPKGTTTFRDVTACACCEVIYDGLVKNNKEHLIDEEIAFALCTGLVCDSLSFRYRWNGERNEKFTELGSKYKAKTYKEKLPIGDKGISYLVLRELDGLIRSLSSKDKETQLAKLWIPNVYYKERVNKGGFRSLSILQEQLLTTMFTKALVVAYEYEPGLGKLRFITNVPEIAHFFNKKGIRVFTEFGYSTQVLTLKQAKSKYEETKKLMQEFKKENPELFRSS